MRRLAALSLMVALAGATARAALAHPDTLGAPDPQWQRFPDAPPEAETRRPADDGPRDGSGLRILETLVYGVGTLAVLLVVVLVRSFWSPRGDSDPPA